VRMKRDLAGRSVGAVGLGCMSFGGIYGGTDEDESFACLAEALALGCRPLGRGRDLWQRRVRDGDGQVPRPARADVSIATKAGIYRTPTRHFRNDEEALRRSLEGSLSRLGRDRVELFYIHRREAERPDRTGDGNPRRLHRRGSDRVHRAVGGRPRDSAPGECGASRGRRTVGILALVPSAGARVASGLRRAWDDFRRLLTTRSWRLRRPVP
jgi:hypothetical protein